MNNLSKFFVQQQNNIKEWTLVFGMVAVCAITALSFLIFCTKLSDLYFELELLRGKEQTHKIEWHIAWEQDRIKRNQQEVERKEYIKKWQKENPKLAGIFYAR